MKAIGSQLRSRRTTVHPGILLLLPVLLVYLLALSACVPVQTEQSSRQAEVAARGAEVMPFDLEQTMHVFTPREGGGLQQVVVREGADDEQIALIRAHLSEEAERFRAGDFDDPGQIHGHEMPGLAELRKHDGRIDIRYSELPDGAQIEYVAVDPLLIEAIHHWFEAQLMDHGSHARK